ncbi:Ankyrin-3 [Hordeum vulgare]|nr:Ankyrin-3 [Hordeum vulgare]
MPAQPTEEGDICGISNPSAPSHHRSQPPSLEFAAAQAKSTTVKATPTGSHQWASSFSGVLLHDDVWEVRMHFHDTDNLERSMCISYITFCNLIALIETDGYGLNDYMYYVRKPGVGISGLEEICDDEKVVAMLDHIASREGKVVNLTVIRATDPRPADLNSVVAMDEGNAADQDGLEILMDLKRRTKVANYRKHKKAVGQVHMVRKNLPILLTKDDSNLEADEEFLERLSEIKKHRENPFLHFEGHIDVDEVYDPDEKFEEKQEVEQEEEVEEEE